MSSERRIGRQVYITRHVRISCSSLLLQSSSQVVHIFYGLRSSQDALFPFPRRSQWPFNAAKIATNHSRYTQADTRNKQSTTTNAYPCTANNTPTKRLRSAATDLRTATSPGDEREAINLRHRAQHLRRQANAGAPKIEEHVVSPRDRRRFELQGKKRGEGKSCCGDA